MSAERIAESAEPTAETLQEQAILAAVRALPPDKRQEVLDFAEFLRQRKGQRQPRTSLEGKFAHLGISFSAEEIDEARQEMWANFPRDFTQWDDE